MKPEDLLTSTSYHEAGHAIVALYRGIVPEYVEVRYNESCQRWDGVTALPLLQGNIEEKLISQFAICFGGLFAQAKHSITEVCANEEVPWKRLFDWAFQGAEHTLDVLLQCGEKLSIPTWWFQGGDLDQFAFISEQVISTLDAATYKAILQKSIPGTLFRFWKTILNGKRSGPSLSCLKIQ